MTPSFERRVSKARRVLVLGIGGGGDVVGALAVARRCEALGTPFVLGGVAWERLPVDPYPGPRSVRQIKDGDPLGRARRACGTETRRRPRECAFSESHLASHLGSPTVLIDVTEGARGSGVGDRGGGGPARLRSRRLRRRRRRRDRRRRTSRVWRARCATR